MVRGYCAGSVRELRPEPSGGGDRPQNRLEEAEPLYRRALRILVLTSVRSGRDSPDLQTVRGNYSSCLKERGRSKAEIRVELNAVDKEARAQQR